MTTVVTIGEVALQTDVSGGGFIAVLDRNYRHDLPFLIAPGRNREPRLITTRLRNPCNGNRKSRWRPTPTQLGSGELFRIHFHKYLYRLSSQKTPASSG